MAVAPLKLQRLWYLYQQFRSSYLAVGEQIRKSAHNRPWTRLQLSPTDQLGQLKLMELPILLYYLFGTR